MLGCGDQHPFLHQAGGIADASDIAPAGFDGKVIKIGTTEDDAGVCWRGSQSDMAEDASVKADAFGRDFVLKRRLEHVPGY